MLKPEGGRARKTVAGDALCLCLCSTLHPGATMRWETSYLHHHLRLSFCLVSMFFLSPFLDWASRVLLYVFSLSFLVDIDRCLVSGGFSFRRTRADFGGAVGCVLGGVLSSFFGVSQFSVLQVSAVVYWTVVVRCADAAISAVVEPGFSVSIFLYLSGGKFMFI